MKELIINKPSELLTIKNRNTYTSLTLNCEVNPKLLFGFTNIKELTINNEEIVINNLNEVNINKLPFINNLERINFKNIQQFGKKEIKDKKSYITEYDYYTLNANNLENITFLYDKRPTYREIKMYEKYLANCNNLEMITIESKDDISIEYTFQIPEKLKYVCLKLLEKEYIIDFSSKMTHIKRIFFDLESKSIEIKYSNNIVSCYDEIDIITDKTNSRKKLILLSDDLINNDTLYIPDYISCIDFRNKDYFKKIEHISFNINILNAQENQFYITDKNRLDILKTIELRTNKEMALFPNIKINIKDYGTINDLYIEENKLYIVFKDFILVVNKEGLISKEIIETEQETEEISHFLDDYTIEELEEYLQYRKLLETYKYEDDKELNDAINTIGYKVIKKLTR